MQMALRAELEGGVVSLLRARLCVSVLVSHYPQIETNRGGSALRSKPPHHLPLTSQPSKCVFHLAL